LVALSVARRTVTAPCSGATERRIAGNGPAAQSGTVFNDLEKCDLAIADFDKAISLNPIFGKSLARLKRYDEAFAA
jgi:hypothetical protein